MYYIVYGLFYCISLLPLRALYLLSDAAYFFLYYIIGYRKKVVFSNLEQAFPGKSDKERTIIAKRFYQNFADNFIEFIKLVSASPAYISRHFIGDYSLLQQLYQEGRRCQVLFAHVFNWEWACLSMPQHIQHDFLVVYMPIGSKVLDRVFLKVRSKTGAILLPATSIQKAILPFRHQIYLLALVADQNPGNAASAFWVNFFGRPAPFVRGPESGARRGNIPVIFARVEKVKRGYYKIGFEMGVDNPSTLEKGMLTKKYVEYLETIISAHPDTWLWSHRRWKWEWKQEYGNIIK